MGIELNLLTPLYAAEAAIAACDPAKQRRLREKRGPGAPGSSGLAIFFPGHSWRMLGDERDENF